MAILAGEPAVLDAAQNNSPVLPMSPGSEGGMFDGSDNSGVDTVYDSSDDDDNSAHGPTPVDYEAAHIHVFNNRLDTDERGDSIFIDIRNVNLDDPSSSSPGVTMGAVIDSRGVYSTAGYDHRCVCYMCASVCLSLAHSLTHTNPLLLLPLPVLAEEMWAEPCGTCWPY